MRSILSNLVKIATFGVVLQWPGDAQTAKPRRTAPQQGSQAHKPEQAVGQIVDAGTATIVRSGDQSKLLAQPGDLLFGGDQLAAGSTTTRFVYCPAGGPSSNRSLQANGSATFGAAGISAEPGVVSSLEPVPYCELPVVDRFPELNAKSVTAGVDTAVLEPLDRSKFTAADLQALDKLDAVLAANPADVVAHTARATLLRRTGFTAEAAREYGVIAKAQPMLAWAKLLVQEDASAPPPKTPMSNAPVYAVVIGISKYGRPSAIPDLKFADRDAQSFYNYLRSPRGGNMPEANIKLLVNEQATNSAIKDYIGQFLGKPRSKLIVFLSGHGAVSGGEGYMVTYRSDPNNLRDSAYPMRALTQLMYGGSSGRVELYVDACRSGHIGSITERNSINHLLMSTSGTVFGMMASRDGEVAWEYPGLGAGHGAFTYFLLRALNSNDAYDNGKLSIYDLTHYVEDKVRFLTLKKQTPQDETSSVDVNEPLAFAKDKGIAVEKWDGKPMPASLLSQQKGGLLFDVDQPPPASPGQSADPRLEQLIAFENQGQAVLLRYLKGDAVAQQRKDFQAGLTAYRQALQLAPDSLYLQSRVQFFEGRLAVADLNYSAARGSLEAAIRLDPASPSAYNALGLAYLEQARYEEAIAAFSDAIRRAIYWPYPRHNLALTYFQLGQYDRAIRTYKEAIASAADQSYLPYNLGLLYERIHRPEEAKASYLDARELARKRAEQAAAEAEARPDEPVYREEAARLKAQRVPPAAALSLQYGNLGDRKAEQRYYQEAIDLLKGSEDTVELAIVRHNHAVYLAGRKKGLAEALQLWRSNAHEFHYEPSEVSLAETLLAKKPKPDTEAAIQVYREAVAAEPQSVGVRYRLAGLLAAQGRREEALTQMQEVNAKNPGSVLVLEQLGDLQAQLHRTEARSTYERAAALTNDPKARAGLLSKAGKAQ